MAYLIKFENQARKELSSLDNSIKIKILKYLKKLAERENPRTLGKPLKQNLSGYWRYRVGDYHIISVVGVCQYINIPCFFASMSNQCSKSSFDITSKLP